MSKQNKGPNTPEYTTCDLPFIVTDSPPPDAIIKVVGVGGCGCNSVGHMFDLGASGIELFCVNTDAQALELLKDRCNQSLQIGQNTTAGLGAGSDPGKGFAAAIEDRARITSMLAGADLLFIVAGMGGGTGTGASPVIAEIAQGLGILTVAVVTEPFLFENRDGIAMQGIEQIRSHVDSIISLSNNKLMKKNKGQQRSIRDCFAYSNDVLYESVIGISDLITQPGMINVDFADLQAIMKASGRAIIGIGLAQGESRAKLATEYALDNPLNDGVVNHNVCRILINISASEQTPLTLGDYQTVNEVIDQRFSAHGAKKVVGTTIDPNLQDRLKVTLIATAFAQNQQNPPFAGSMTAYGIAGTTATQAAIGAPPPLSAQTQTEKVFGFSDWNGDPRR